MILNDIKICWIVSDWTCLLCLVLDVSLVLFSAHVYRFIILRYILSWLILIFHTAQTTSNRQHFALSFNPIKLFKYIYLDSNRAVNFLKLKCVFSYAPKNSRIGGKCGQYSANHYTTNGTERATWLNQSSSLATSGYTFLKALLDQAH